MAYTFLVEEDEPAIRDLYERVLNGKFPHSTVAIVENGDKAISCIDETVQKGGKIDLAIFDNAMTGKNGEEVLKYVLSNNIPIKVIIASGESDRKEEFMKKGADCFLAKPFSIDSLVGEVSRVLGYVS